MIVGATFLTMLNTLGNASTFWVYAALNRTVYLADIVAGTGNKHVRWGILNVI